jgi:hypothetical protein
MFLSCAHPASLPAASWMRHVERSSERPKTLLSWPTCWPRASVMS